MATKTLYTGDYVMIGCAVMGVIVLICGLWLVGGREWLGSRFANLLPRDTFQQGDKAHVYLNGKYNRTATLSKVVADAIYIYDNQVRLPLDYRGRFYGIGVDPKDGSRLVYLHTRKYYRLIRVAELIRKVFALIDDESNLNPDYEAYEQILNDTVEEAEYEK